MPHISILSEDPVFSGLISRNLWKRGYEVAVHLVDGRTVVEPQLVKAMALDKLVIMDLLWYNPAHLETYSRLVNISGQIGKPLILLLDGSWAESWEEKFHATVTLRKPFSMARVMQTVDTCTAAHPPESS